MTSVLTERELIDKAVLASLSIKIKDNPKGIYVESDDSTKKTRIPFIKRKTSLTSSIADDDPIADDVKSDDSTKKAKRATINRKVVETRLTNTKKAREMHTCAVIALRLQLEEAEKKEIEFAEKVARLEVLLIEKKEIESSCV